MKKTSRTRMTERETGKSGFPPLSKSDTIRGPCSVSTDEEIGTGISEK